MGSALEMTSATHAWTAHTATHHLLANFLATEDVQTIDGANHTIAVYTIISIY